MANKEDLNRQPSLLDGYATDNVDEFLAKALVIDKGQKQLIKRLYQDREEIVPNCASELALRAIVTQSFLSVSEGRKLAAHFLVDTLECKPFWEMIKKQIKFGNPNRALCQHWGDVILHAWKFAEVIPLDEDAINKKDVEAEVIQELFFSVVFTNKRYLQKFTWIIEGFLSNEEPSKKINAMLFRCVLPTLWRHLEVPNEDIRIATSNLLLRFYPLRSDDDFVDAEYLQKQHEAMDRMLMDECLPIRIEATKKVLFHVGRNWKSFPSNVIKSYLYKIVDQLAYDNAVDVRAAVYEGMEGLLKCVPALTATQHSLELLAKKGINDKTEKVRLAAFKLLNKLKGNRFIKYFDVIDMDDMLLRLDFEHSTAVQSQIVSLVYKSFCPKLVEGIDYIERFKRIRYMNKISRTASLNFHRLIYPLKLVTPEEAVRHIRSLLIGVKAMLKQKVGSTSSNGNSNGSGDEIDDLSLDITGATILFNEQGEELKENAQIFENDEKLLLAKNILDCAIVLWTSIRFELYTKCPKENVEVIKSMSNILQALDPYSNTILMDSALVIASSLPKDKVGRLFGKVLSIIQKGNVSEHYFGHYVEALANWDINKLIEIIVKGLEKLRSFVAEASGHSISATPSKSRAKDSPPSKRLKIVGAEQVEELKRPLDFIRILLSCPNPSDNLKTHFGVHLSKFCEILATIRNYFEELLKSDNWKNVDLKLMVSAYETLTMLSLITKNAEVDEINIDSNDEDSEEFENFYVGDFLFLKEVKWLESILFVNFPPNQVIQAFLRCANLHLECGKLSVTVMARLARLLMRLKERVEQNCGLESLEEAIKKNATHLSRALQYSDDQLAALRILEEKVRPVLAHFQMNETEENYDEENV